MGDGYLYPAAENPDDVEREVDAARFAAAEICFPAEGEVGVNSDFHELPAEGNADDGEAVEEAGEDVARAEQEAAQHEP